MKTNYAIAFAAFLILDFLYLNLTKQSFLKQVFKIQRKAFSMKWLPAVICYIALILLLYHFILRPRRTIQEAFLLGLCVYVVYETTNMSLFTDWEWKTVVIDSLWGGTLFALATTVFYKVPK
jgi:uncharacterized membrane protein